MTPPTLEEGLAALELENAELRARLDARNTAKDWRRTVGTLPYDVSAQQVEYRFFLPALEAFLIARLQPAKNTRLKNLKLPEAIS